MAHSQFDLLKTKRFLPVFLTQFLGAFNDNVYKNALIILITYFVADRLSVDSRVLVTLAAGLFILPFFLFSAVAGSIIDAHEKSIFIRRIKMIEIILMILASLGFYLENVTLLMLVLFLMGTQSAFFGPVKYSILPDLLKEDELIGGNALFESGTFLAILLGTIIGGILILKDGGIAIISGIVVAIAVIGRISSIYIPKTQLPDKKVRVNYNIFSATVGVIRNTAKQKDIFLAIIGISWFWLVGFVFLSQFPIFGKEILGGDENVVTMLLTVFSIGIAVGSLLCNRLLGGDISSKYVPLGAIGMTIFIIILWVASLFIEAGQEPAGISIMFSGIANIFIMLSMLLIAVFGGIYIVPLYAIMQARADASHRSRVIATNNIINALFMVIGAVIAILMLKLNLSVTDIFLAVGLGNIPVAWLIGRTVKRQVAVNS